MTREEARELLLGYSRFINEETDLWEALDLAIEALKGDLHCPKCGTIVRDGRQYHDLVYRGEAEKHQLSGETSTISEKESVDCISRADTIKAMCRECKVFPDDVVNCADCTEVAIVKGMPTCNQKQVTGKLKNPDDSLLTDDSEACKEQKSKLDCISRADAIAYIDRIINSGLGKNKSLDYIRKYISALPSAETHEIRTETHGVCSDCISRQQAIDEVKKMEMDKISIVGFWELIESLPPVTPIAKTQQADTLIIADALRSFSLDCGRHVSDRERAGELREQVLAYGASMCQPVTPTERIGWIPVSERLPEELEEVLVCVTHNGESKMAVSCRRDYNYWDCWGRDIIGEMAWMPLPEPYKGGDTE